MSSIAPTTNIRTSDLPEGLREFLDEHPALAASQPDWADLNETSWNDQDHWIDWVGGLHNLDGNTGVHAVRHDKFIDGVVIEGALQAHVYIGGNALDVGGWKPEDYLTSSAELKALAGMFDRASEEFDLLDADLAIVQWRWNDSVTEIVVVQDGDAQNAQPLPWHFVPEEFVNAQPGSTLLADSRFSVEDEVRVRPMTLIGKYELVRKLDNGRALVRLVSSEGDLVHLEDLNEIPDEEFEARFPQIAANKPAWADQIWRPTALAPEETSIEVSYTGLDGVLDAEMTLDIATGERTEFKYRLDLNEISAKGTDNIREAIADLEAQLAKVKAALS